MNGANAAGLIVGAALLLGAWDVIDLSLLRRLLVPLILILIGVSILLSNTRTKRAAVNAACVFGGVNIK